MTERLAFVALVAVLAIAIALLLRRGAVVRRKPFTGPRQPTTLTLFAADDCGGCAVVERRLEGLGLSYERITWSEHPDRFREAGVDGVPTLVSMSGGDPWQVRGIPTPRQLRTWLQ